MKAVTQTKWEERYTYTEPKHNPLSNQPRNNQCSRIKYCANIHSRSLQYTRSFTFFFQSSLSSLYLRRSPLSTLLSGVTNAIWRGEEPKPPLNTNVPSTNANETGLHSVRVVWIQGGGKQNVDSRFSKHIRIDTRAGYEYHGGGGGENSLPER